MHGLPNLNNGLLYTAISIECTILKQISVVWASVFDAEKRQNLLPKFLLEDK